MTLAVNINSVSIHASGFEVDFALCHFVVAAEVENQMRIVAAWIVLFRGDVGDVYPKVVVARILKLNGIAVLCAVDRAVFGYTELHVHLDAEAVVQILVVRSVAGTGFKVDVYYVPVVYRLVIAQPVSAVCDGGKLDGLVAVAVVEHRSCSSGRYGRLKVAAVAVGLHLHV